jgi:YjbE family integral membrane protein
MSFSFWVAAGGIALVDLVLSGDNALVIGAAAARLQRSRRLFAIFWGGLGAIVLRLVMTSVATELLQVRYLQAFGGVVIFAIAIRLLLPEAEHGRWRTASDRVLPAILTILAADVTMSLDNVLAVGALAAGNILLLVAGLLFSMCVLLVASSIVARLMDRFGWLIDVAAVVLAWTAGNLFFADPFTLELLRPSTSVQVATHCYLVGLLLVIDLALRAFRKHAKRVRTQAEKLASPPDFAASGNGAVPSEVGLDTVTAPEQARREHSRVEAPLDG